MDLPLLRNVHDLKGKRVILRADLNVPVKDGAVLDDFRIRKIFPTLRHLRDHGATVIIASHHSEEGQSLKPVAGRLGDSSGAVFVSDILNGEIEKSKEKVFLCENIRFREEEERNDEEFAKKVAALGDIYVNDAFAASHRKHASVVSLPKFLPSCVGFLFEEEVKHLSAAFHPPHPFLFILGGGKVASKFHLIERFVNVADTIFAGGAVAHIFFLERGCEIGESLVEDVAGDAAALLRSGKIMLPADVKVKNDQGAVFKKPENVEPGDMILDVGPATLSALAGKVREAEFILWNGPVGDYMVPGFEKGTEELIRQIAASEAISVTGGGDTAGLIRKLGAFDRFDFVSTGGGAMLEFLAERTLPGIEAIKVSRMCLA